MQGTETYSDSDSVFDASEVSVWSSTITVVLILSL